MDKIIVSQKRSTTLLYIICTAFACVVMIFMIFNVKVGDGGAKTARLFSTPFGVAAAKVFLAVCAVACAYCVVFFIKRLANPKPLIIVDESGFTDNSNSSSVGFVPWRDVKRIYMVTMKHNKLIQVELTYPEEYLNRMSGLVRKTAELNMKLGYQPISFSLNGTGKNPDKFLADMISIWERNK
ncbi:MAG: hypothetical protein K2J11_07630 [Oscillospiraceae bacterium]|nr:hypothetical protein [Oscillospiraceae bacterium]